MKKEVEFYFIDNEKINLEHFVKDIKVLLIKSEVKELLVKYFKEFILPEVNCYDLISLVGIKEVELLTKERFELEEYYFYTYVDYNDLQRRIIKFLFKQELENEKSF